LQNWHANAPSRLGLCCLFRKMPLWLNRHFAKWQKTVHHIVLPLTLSSLCDTCPTFCFCN